MEQMARNVTDKKTGGLRDIRDVLHDRGTKFCLLSMDTDGRWCNAGEAACRSPNLNAFAQRWVGAVKEEFLSKLMLFAKARSNGRLQNSLLTIITNVHIRGRETCVSSERMLRPKTFTEGGLPTKAWISAALLLPRCLSLSTERGRWSSNRPSCLPSRSFSAGLIDARSRGDRGGFSVIGEFINGVCWT
jgi:hypothetical protein